MTYACPKCGCTNFGQYRHPKSKIWCVECGYIHREESNGIASIEKCKPLDPSKEPGYIPPLIPVNTQLLDKEAFIQQYVLLNRHEYFSASEVVNVASECFDQIKRVSKE